jgi:predicted AAA+ superfamily ATPase
MRPIHHTLYVPEVQGLRPRHQCHSVSEALADTRVVLIAGPRQSGKSTLAQMILSGLNDPLALNLDDDVTRRSALEDPAGLIQHEGPVFVDEIQRAPDLLLAIKAAVDRDPRPGRFLLTGSANVLQLPRVADALPGRMEIVDLWPFSQGELNGKIERFIDRAFNGWEGVRIVTSLDRRNYLELATIGGFPEVVIRREARRRRAWFEGYVRTLVQRDVRDVSAIERGDLGRLMRLVAARSGQLLNIDNLARDAAMPPSTARRYLNLLELAFIALILPAWANSRTTRAVHAPKVFITDSGLLSHLSGASPESLSASSGNAGPILETFVAMELRKQLAWSIERPTMHHYRSKDGVEVDVVLESADGRVVGIEVKAAATVRPADFAGLRHLASRVGSLFRAGLVLYAGRESVPFGSSMWCVPISSLWQA